MKIAIVGAGIGGLSTYLSLKKHLLSSQTLGEVRRPDISIKIYDAYDVGKSTLSSQQQFSGSGNDRKTKDGEEEDEPVFTPEAIGSAIGISVNGMNVLRRLGDETVDFGKELLKRGHPLVRWEMRNARGWVLVDVNMVSKEERKDKLFDGVMVSRQSCWQMLRDEVVKDGVVERRKVVDVVIGDDERRSVLHFAEGDDEEEVDLVIGADGLRSVVRKAIFQHENTEKRDTGNKEKTLEKNWVTRWWLSSWSKEVKAPDYITPHYEGLVGVGGFLPASLLAQNNQPPGTMSIVFGPNGFFGYGYIDIDDNNNNNITSSPAEPSSAIATSSSTLLPSPGTTAVYWSTFSSPTANPFPLPNTTPKPYSFNRSAALAALLSRHRSWKNPTIQAILSYAEEHGVEGFYPTWTTPELPTWQQNGRVVLVGDAAHALQPSSGQGACQALEDAEALGLLLKHYLFQQPEMPKREVDATSKALTKFDALRKPRVHAIWERSQKMSGIKADMGFLMEMMMYLMIWLMTFFHDKYNDILFGYDLPKEVEKIIREDEGQ